MLQFNKGRQSPGLPKPPPLFPGREEQPQTGLQQQFPQAPPSVKRSTNPFAKDNLSQTLLDIGSSFLSNDNFFQGLGQAGQAVGGRAKALRQGPNRTEVGGPDNQFEIITDEEGNRTYRQIPEFAKVLADKAALKERPSAKDTIDLRSRALYAINQLPQEQRSAAYADMMLNPNKYGGVDTAGMPVEYNPNFASVMGGMGQTVNQAIGSDFRREQFNHRQTVDNTRIDQTERRLSKPKATGGIGGGRSRAATKPPTGFILD